MEMREGVPNLVAYCYDGGYYVDDIDKETVAYSKEQVFLLSLP